MGRNYSGNSIFAAKIICGDCGGFYGPKVWHSTDKYRKIIYRCNCKYDGQKCETPTITEEMIKKGFVTAVNTLIADKDKLLDDCRYMQSILSDTSEIEEELKRQNEELEVLTEMLRKCVEENTHKVQNQKEYWEKYNSIEGRWNAVRSKIAELEETKKARTIKAEIIGAFMFELHEQDCAIEDFDARLWTVTIDSVVVNKDGSFTYKFRNDLELTVPAE